MKANSIIVYELIYCYSNSIFGIRDTNRVIINSNSER